MKRNILLLIIWLAVTILSLVFSDTYYSLIIVIVLCILSPMLLGCDRFDKYEWFCALTITSILIINITAAIIGLQIIKQDDDSYILTSQFYPIGRILDTGEKVDTLNLARCYKQTDENDPIVVHEDMYLLRQKKMSVLFSRNELILQGTDIKFRSKDYGHGQLTVCSFKTKAGKCMEVDLYGSMILYLNMKIQIKMLYNIVRR